MIHIGPDVDSELAVILIEVLRAAGLEVILSCRD